MRAVIFVLALHMIIAITSVYSNYSYNFYSETYIRDLKLAKCIYKSEKNQSIILGSSRSLMGYGVENKVINYALPGGGYIESKYLMSCISKDATILFPLEYDRFDTNYNEYQHQSPVWKAYRQFGLIGGGLAHLLNFGLSFDFLLGITKRFLGIKGSSFNKIGMGQGDLLSFNESIKYTPETWRIDMSLIINNDQLARVNEICKDPRSIVFFHPMISFAEKSSQEPSITFNDAEYSLKDISSYILKNCTNEKKANERNILFYDSELFYDYSHLKPELGNKILRDMRIMEKL